MKVTIHKLLLAVICMLGIKIATAQAFKKEWNDFSDKFWKISFIIDSDKFYGNQSYGAIEFQCDSDPNIAVIFSVYKKAKWHLGQDTLSKYYMMQNCIGGGFSAPDFTKGEYYYFPEPCTHCQDNGKLRRECAYLYNKLHLLSDN